MWQHHGDDIVSSGLLLIILTDQRLSFGYPLFQCSSSAKLAVDTVPVVQLESSINFRQKVGKLCTLWLLYIFYVGLAVDLLDHGGE